MSIEAFLAAGKSRVLTDCDASLFVEFAVELIDRDGEARVLNVGDVLLDTADVIEVQAAVLGQFLIVELLLSREVDHAHGVVGACRNGCSLPYGAGLVELQEGTA